MSRNNFGDFLAYGLRWAWFKYLLEEVLSLVQFGCSLEEVSSLAWLGRSSKEISSSARVLVEEGLKLSLVQILSRGGLGLGSVKVFISVGLELSSGAYQQRSQARLCQWFYLVLHWCIWVGAHIVSSYGFRSLGRPFSSVRWEFFIRLTAVTQLGECAWLWRFTLSTNKLGFSLLLATFLFSLV